MGWPPSVNRYAARAIFMNRVYSHVSNLTGNKPCIIVHHRLQCIVVPSSEGNFVWGCGLRSIGLEEIDLVVRACPRYFAEFSGFHEGGFLRYGFSGKASAFVEVAGKVRKRGGDSKNSRVTQG